MVDHACTALSRIAESYARHPDRLDMLCDHGLISNAVQLVRISHPCSVRGVSSMSVCSIGLHLPLPLTQGMWRNCSNRE